MSSIFWRLVLYFRLKKNKEDPKRTNERFGNASKFSLEKLEAYKKECEKQNKNPKIVWVHAVSVGESLSVLNFIKILTKNGWFVILTTTTKTSAELMKTKLINNSVHQYNPYPSNKYVKTFIKTWQPQKVFFVESEIFPNIVKLLSRQNIPVYLLNARMSDSSFKTWKKLKFYIKNTIRRYKGIYAQNDEEANKFALLGGYKDRIKCLGNLKFDISNETKDDIVAKFNDTDNILPDVAKCKLFQQNVKKNNPQKKIIVFCSVHEDEFFHLVWQYSHLLKKAHCTAIFIPRYVEEKEKLQKIAKENVLQPVLFSTFTGAENGDILIVDAFGIANYFYVICDIAVVCGNFAKNIGGHNPIEPIMLEKPTIVGQYCDKCKNTIHCLLQKKAIIQTKHLSADLLNLIKNEKLSTELVKNGTEFLKDNNGATKKIVADIFKEVI